MLSSDHEVLGVLGVLQHGESSGALDALCRVHMEDGRAVPDRKESQPLVRWGSFVPVPAGKDAPQFFGADVALHSHVILR